jgi:putative ABC transport system permease protein
MSLIPLALAGIARRFGAPNRLTWSIVGLYLSAYWMMPTNLHDKLFGKLDGNIEMFVLSGIMIVTGFTLVIIFNARLLTSIVERSGNAAARYRASIVLGALTAALATAGVVVGSRADGLGSIFYLVAALSAVALLFAVAAARFPRLAPALKMGIAYPLANRFRTGMTIAMFSLIIFSLTTFSILVANSNTLYTGNNARGGLDVFATTNRGNPVPDLKAALAAVNSPAANEIDAVGRVTVTHELPEVKQPNQTAWQGYAVEAADDAFYAKVQPLLEDRASGYADDAAVLTALRTQPNVALIDRNALLEDGDSPYAWHTDGVKVTDHQFAPFQVAFRDPASGKTGTLTVIGVLKSQLLSGLWTNAQTYAPVLGEPVYERHFVTLAPGAKAEMVVKDIKGALVTQGVNAQSSTELLDEASAENTVFTRMFQGFMALGLLVGIAALGVIAFRSIVERRQQIGMLRAIGYQRGTVALSFLFEGSFIALMGVLSGVVGASVLARNLLTSESFTEGQKVTFFIPWTEVSVFVVAAVAFSLLMTWWPSRGAARIAIAEALRYE